MRRRVRTMAKHGSSRIERLIGAALVALALIAGPLASTEAAAQAPPADVNAKAPAAAQAASSGGDSGLRARVESLEEQLVDMQVVVGTLESLAKSGGAAPAPAFRPSPNDGGGSSDGARMENLEAQIRQLSTQVQALSDQLRNNAGMQRRSDAVGAPPQDAPAANFGATTVTQGHDGIGGLIAGDGPLPPTGAATDGLPSPVATGALPPASDPVEPKQLYETAYGYLLQRDYGAAEAAFDDFLKRFPTDSLSGNAQYWLGESHFVRGQYKAAAGAFLKGYQTYAQSQKAPDSLLKLAMSLDRLGQKDAACSSFAELGVKFPNAAQSIKARAQSERQRVGCG
ncbi:MAG: tol-pal system protein YbgF [Hyphomicrobium sp.]